MLWRRRERGGVPKFGRALVRVGAAAGRCEWKDFHYHGKALPDKNLWNEETPTASKAGKRPDRDTPPSLQSSFVQRRRLRRSARLAQGLAEKSSTSESV